MPRPTEAEKILNLFMQGRSFPKDNLMREMMEEFRIEALNPDISEEDYSKAVGLFSSGAVAMFYQMKKLIATATGAEDIFRQMELLQAEFTRDFEKYVGKCRENPEIFAVGQGGAKQPAK